MNTPYEGPGLEANRDPFLLFSAPPPAEETKLFWPHPQFSFRKMATGKTWWEEGDDQAHYGRLVTEVDVDDTLPEPIYIKNSDLAEMRRYMNRIDVEDDVFSGDEEDEEGNLNLTAPPLES